MAHTADYGDRIADIYDDLYSGGELVADIVTCVQRLADGGSVLELGVGTGRIALPMAAAGVTITGMDASQSMLDRLRSKPGSDGVATFVGDFATTPLGGPYQLVFVAFNTFFGILDQQSQVDCFRNVASSLVDGGRFVIEAFVPDVARFDRGQRTSLGQLEEGRLSLDVANHDPASQRVTSAHVLIREDGIRILPVEIRYAWPSELDLMAQLTGFELETRWEWWNQTPFTSSSGQHVSVWRKGTEA